MDPLATEADIAARLSRALTGTEAARVDALLTDASAAVRSHVPQEFTRATTTDRLLVRRGVVRLPQRPVIAIDAVIGATGNPVLYRWDGDDLLHSTGDVPDTFAWVPYCDGPRYVDVTYTHGYAPIPDDIVAVVCSIVTRALGRIPTDAGLTSESIAGYSYSIGSAAAAGGLGMLPDERAVLDFY
jgi:hypothetical protein